MARSRHAMHVHPLRSRGVVVGVPVAAAVAFGAHTVLGVTPLSDQQDTRAPSSAPQAGAPVQSYGLAPTPPPTTLGLLSEPSSTTHDRSGSSSDAAHTPAGAGRQVSKITGSSATAHGAAAPAGSVPIARVASAPAPAAAPPMMTFKPALAAAPESAAPAAGTREAAPRTVERAAAPAAAAHDDSSGEATSSSGGSLLGVDLGVAKVSVLSFGG